MCTYDIVSIYDPYLTFYVAKGKYLFLFFLTSVCYPERVGICAFGGSRRVVEEGLCLAFFLTLQPLPRRRRPIFDGGLRVHAQDDR